MSTAVQEAALLLSGVLGDVSPGDIVVSLSPYDGKSLIVGEYLGKNADGYALVRTFVTAHAAFFATPTKNVVAYRRWSLFGKEVSFYSDGETCLGVVVGQTIDGGLTARLYQPRKRRAELHRTELLRPKCVGDLMMPLD